jgi:hypothetical protein
MGEEAPSVNNTFNTSPLSAAARHKTSTKPMKEIEKILKAFMPSKYRFVQNVRMLLKSK